MYLQVFFADMAKQITSRKCTIDVHRLSNKGQANKSVGRMPRHQEPTKDVTSCEKLRGAANER